MTSERFPELPDAWVQLARVHVKVGNLERATDVAESMLEGLRKAGWTEA